MAQTKTRAPTKSKSSSGSQKSQSRSRGSSKKTKSRASGKATRAKASTNGKARTESALQTVEHGAKDAGQAVGRAASKAKVPLMAGGAALAGAAGGLALGMRQSRHRGIRRPKLKVGSQVKVSSRDLTKAAREVGNFGTQVGHLASELQRTREAANGTSSHRSPVEVVLQGLTARRSRH